MPAILYATAGDISPENSFNASLCAKNKLNLLPEHLAQIGSAFIHQLTIAPLTARDMRILTAIYDQTIGYDKREDDMNGARLEQLTGIRSDHANESVRRLDALHIIQTRQGHYGKWMSINFDFPNWGKACPESATNDPHCLLSDTYQSALQNDIVAFQLHILPESKKEEATVVIKADENTVSPPPVLLSKSTPDPVKPSPSSTETPEAEPFKLHFPDSFSEKLRQLIIRHLAPLNLPQQAQRLLDYFAKCLRNGKIRNPIAYFINLKSRWLTGALNLNDDQQSPVTSEKKEQQQQKINHRIAYQNAVADLDQLKKVIKIVITQEHCTFEEALKKINYTCIWEKAIECLEQTQKAC